MLEIGRNPSVSLFASYFMRGHILSDFHTIQKNLIASEIEGQSLTLEGTSYAFLFSTAVPKDVILESLALIKGEFMSLPYALTAFRSLKKIEMPSNMFFEVLIP